MEKRTIEGEGSPTALLTTRYSGLGTFLAAVGADLCYFRSITNTVPELLSSEARLHRVVEVCLEVGMEPTFIPTVGERVRVVDRNAIPALAQLHVRSSLRRIDISRDHISDLENRIQNTLVAIAKSRALIAQSDKVCNRVRDTTVGLGNLHDEV